MELQSLSTPDICRACLQKVENVKFNLLDVQDLRKMFYACTSMEIVENDAYTKFLCEMCFDTIEKFYKFREMCTESYSKLETISKTQNLVKSETTLDPCETLDVNLLDDNSNSSTIKEELVESDDNQDADKDLDYSPDLSVKEENSNEKTEETDNNKSKSKNSRKKPTKKNSKTEKEKMLSCELCPKKFFLDSRLEAHLRTHKGLKPYGCDKCNKQFMKKAALTIHYEVIHNNLKKLHHCTEPGCDKAYSTKRGLQIHYKRIHILLGKTIYEPCVCEECGKVLASKTSLREHRFIHTGQSPYKCDKCPKKFSSAHKLKFHIMRHEGIKNFVCPHCGLRKVTQKELKVHLNYHTKEKIFNCPHCSSSFLNNTNLGLHVRVVHKGIRAYLCTYCDRSFGKPDTLKHHIMTHTGEKPHECKTCGKRFIQVVALRMHLKRNTKCKV